MGKRIAVIGLKGLPAFGGAASVGESLLHELQHEFDFTVYSVSSHTDAQSGMIGNYRQIVFRKSRIKQLNTLFYFLKSLFHVLFVKRYDLVHIHHGSSGFIMPFLRLKYKTVVTFHGIYREETVDPKFNRMVNRLLKFSQQLNMRFASRIVSVSKPDADYLNAQYDKHVAYIPNGVFTDLGQQKRTDGPYLVFAANRVYEIKGLHLVLEAMHQNNDMRRLVVIGDLEHQPAYKQLILQLAEGLNVVFTGLIKDKRELFGYITGAELFLFPSLTEAMSMMLLEVASLGVPVIASDIEANRAVFTDEQAIFFRSGDSGSLAEKLQESREDAEKLRRLSENASEYVRKFHQWPVIAAQYREIFNELTQH